MKRTPPLAFVEELYARHHRLENLYPDPLVFARGYEDPEDGELAGLVAAALAYGRVGKILEALEGVFEVLGPRPKRTLENSSPADLIDQFRDFRYRFHKGKDLALFLHLTRRALDGGGRLAELFLRADEKAKIGPAMAAFAGAIFSGDPRPVLRTRAIPDRHPVFHLLPSPSKGGSAKRLCLFLRWMVRKDAIDPGYWHGLIDPSRLVIPLDTHVARVARELAFTSRKSSDWRTAQEITSALRRYDPSDPVRFDFCLFRFGMSRGTS